MPTLSDLQNEYGFGNTQPMQAPPVTYNDLTTKYGFSQPTASITPKFSTTDLTNKYGFSAPKAPLAPADKPNTTIQDWTGIQNPNTYFQDSWNQVKQTVMHPIKAVENVVGAAVGSIVNTAKNVWDTNKTVVTEKPGTTLSQGIADRINAGIADVSIVFAPVSAVFAAAEQVPGLKQAADAVNAVFTATGNVVKYPTEAFINALPIPQESKDVLAPAFGNVGALAGQLILGGKVMEMVMHGKPITEDTVKNDVKTTVEESAKAKEAMTKKATTIEQPEAPKTPIDVTNKLTDEGFKKNDISQIVKDLYNKKPNGDFTEEDINNAKGNYFPKGKDIATVISDMTDKGYTPKEQNTILRNLQEKIQDGTIFNADINKETQALRGEDLYKTESAKAEEAKNAETAKVQKITEKETAKAKAEIDKQNIKVKKAQEIETKAKSAHDNAINKSELSKGKIETSKKDFEQSQKDQQSAQKRLQVSTEKERASRVALEEAKTRVVEAQSKGDKAKTMKARIESAKAKTESIRNKTELEKAKEEAKNSVARTKSLQKELLKAKIEATKAETERLKARQKYVEAQKNSKGLKESSPMSKETIKTVTKTEEAKTSSGEKKTVEPDKKETPTETKKTEGSKTSGLAKSIEAKAIEDGMIKDGFDKLAGYDPATIKGQAKIMSDALSSDINNVREILRGEKPLPDGWRGNALLKATELYLKDHPNEDMTYELANSPLTSEASVHGSELSMLQDREKDSFTRRIQDIKKAREDKIFKGKKEDIVKKAKVEMDKNIIEKSIDDITCG